MQKRRSAWALTTAVLVSALAACGHHGKTNNSDTIQPLTGLPATGTKAEKSRPALFVKIENSSDARPQSGLDSADVVYEVVAEGGITRFAAVFQSTDPGEVGPIRSVRPQDPDLAGPLQGLAVYSGGIPDFVNQLRGVAQDLSSDAIGESAPYRRSSDHPRPHNLYGTAAGFWAKAASPYDEAPQPLFSYGNLPAGAAPASSATLNFSPVSTATWKWDGAAWRRSEDGTPFTVTGPGRIGPANVLVQFVDVTQTSFTDPAGNPVPQSVTEGSGQAELLRDGKVVRGQWSKSDETSPTDFTTDAGKEMPLHPGRTWVELVPNGRSVTIQP